MWPASIVIGFCGVSGVAYTFVVIGRGRRQTRYRPVLEDWAWHAVIPLVAYAALFTASIRMAVASVPSLFAVAASALLLLFVGIHNAWDAVTFVAVERMRGDSQQLGAKDSR